MKSFYQNLFFCSCLSSVFSVFSVSSVVQEFAL
jgi:hypothetical protein